MRLESPPVSASTDVDIAASPAGAPRHGVVRNRALLERDIDALASLIVEEHGNVVSEARAEILKAIELTEFACAMPQIATGEVLEVRRGVECRTERVPVGVVASIAPFNFPSMVPHWTMPNAIALGNGMCSSRRSSCR